MINAIAANPDCSLQKSNDLIQQVLQTNGRDVSMVMLYSLSEGLPAAVRQLQLQLNIGVKNPDQWVPPLVDIATSDANLVPYLRSAYERKTIIVIRLDEIQSTSITGMLKDVEWSGFGEPPKEIVVAPLISAGNLLGFMIMGTNPRREFIDSCRQFVNDVALQIAGKWASAFTVEQAKAREERLIHNLEERERRIRYMAQCAPVGMLHLKVRRLQNFVASREK
jgi:GAF domain-containing protein